MRLNQSWYSTLNGNQVMMLVAIISFVVGALLTGGVALFMAARQPVSSTTGLRESNIPTAHSEYKFIDPLIAVKGVANAPKYATMEQQVATFVNDQKGDGLITASVDFRDFNESGGFTLDPTEMYTPASLNKVPEMIAYFKISESGSAILSDVIEYPPNMGDHNSVEGIKSAVQLTPGNSYTVEQLIEHMIRYSDNNAADLLTQHLKDTNNFNVYAAVFSDLGVDPSVLDHYTDNMSVQKYSIFLRSLYNATYLDRTDSEHALQLLSETDFSEGIESGVPNDVLVAEKFGEVRMTDSSGTLLGKEINNCGIIYYPKHPYLLCVMTKGAGDDAKGLESVLASLSRIVYKNMQSLYP